MPSLLQVPKPPVRHLNRQGLRRLLLGDDVYATTLFVLALDTFGGAPIVDEEQRSFLHWHPSTLQLEIEVAYGVRLPPRNLDKLMAAIAVVGTDLANDVRNFLLIANALCGSGFDPTTFDKADVVECAWAVTEILLLHPPQPGEPSPFSADFKLYLRYLLRQEGFLRAPSTLRMFVAADELGRGVDNFADDPEMFSAIEDVQQGRADEVETIVRDCLIELLLQVQALPLRHGNTAALAKHIDSLLAGSRPKP